MRYRFIATEKAHYAVRTLCRVLRVSRSGFYTWRVRENAGPDPDRVLLVDRVRSIHAAKRGSYGSRRMAQALQREGYGVGRHQARTLMREAGVRCRQRRRRCVTTHSDPRQAVAPNLVQRQFEVEQANRIWVGDITAVWTLEGWLYVAAVLDLHDRQLIGWSMADHMRTELVISALEMAWGRRRPGPGLISHSDRGSQYTAHAYQALLADYDMRASMSRKGDCWDNAVMERFFGSLKSEWTETQRYETRQQARRDIIRYIEMEYNSQRLHSTLGYKTPREIELAAVA